MKRQAALFLAALSLSGCNTTPNAPNSTGNFGVTGQMLTGSSYSMVPGVNPVILGAAALGTINAILPTWSLEDTPIGKDRYRISLRKKTFSSSGGDGEAGQLFKYRAEQITGRLGYDSYQILEYTEGLDSSGAVGVQRVAQGVIQCRKDPAPDNPSQ